jgi:DNA-directed RNA polymerase subunit RPC12/RpoP
LNAEPPRKLVFNEYCSKCGKVVAYEIQKESGRKFLAVCPSCGARHDVRGRKEIYYKETDLWVTRFTFADNVQGVVATRLSKV